MNIALVGLPSAGKSSIINSLIGRRIAQSGVSRTTTESKLYENLISDDKINYKIYDLPGIADIEDNENKFDTLIFDIIKKCNIVFWVSDIIKSFITNHEMKEFIKIQNHIKNLGSKEGIPIQLVILLSKVDKNLESKNEYDKYESCDENNDDINNEEIKCEEHTSIIDIYENIKEKFKDIDIIYFNAFGRSYYHENSSNNLKKFVKQYNPQNININFNLKKYHDNIPLLHDITKINYFIETIFMKNMSDYELIGKKFIEIYSSINIEDNKLKLIKFILYDEEWSTEQYNYTDNSEDNCLSNWIDYDDDETGNPIKINYSNKNDLINKNVKYDTNIWNRICIFIKINIKDHYNYEYLNGEGLINTEYHRLTHNQIYRLIQISNDYDIYDKLILYSHINSRTIDLNYNRLYFVVENIYNLNYLLNGTCFELKSRSIDNSDYEYLKNNYNTQYKIFTKCEFRKDKYHDMNIKYNKQIYFKSFLKKIKEIRKKVFKENFPNFISEKEESREDEIDMRMIPIAYDKFGLFWNPYF